MTLSEFILARVTEDAVRLSALKGLDGPRYGRGSNASLLADCEAKRRIVDLYALFKAAPETPGQTIYALNGALRALALPFADHPDYDEKWKP